MITVYSFPVWVAAFIYLLLKWIVELSNNGKYKLEHCLNIEDSWGGTFVYVSF